MSGALHGIGAVADRFADLDARQSGRSAALENDCMSMVTGLLPSSSTLRTDTSIQREPWSA